MLMISDCSTVTYCDMCNTWDDEIKCTKCRPGFALKDAICQGIASNIVLKLILRNVSFKLSFKLSNYLYVIVLIKATRKCSQKLLFFQTVDIPHQNVANVQGTNALHVSQDLH